MLGWSMLVTMAGAIFYFGFQSAHTEASINILENRQAEDRAEIVLNARAIHRLRLSNERVDQRLIGIEKSQARQEAATNEILRTLRNPQAREVPRNEP